ncbi:unnamed protein product [Calypogeia fissa]
MAAAASTAPVAETSSSPKTLQLYPEKTPLISDFWKEKYAKDAKKYWDMFYKRNANKFFKDRHYLRKEWGHYFSGRGVDADPSVGQAQSSHQEKRQAILEIGCGTGNTIYPLIETYPQAYVYACDFSPRAVDLVKAHEGYDESRVNAFVCDVTTTPLSEEVPLASVDVITLIFVLSAITPEKMPAVLRNLKAVLKPGGLILIRDYAVGDLAQERFMLKDQQISENFYVRGDGTLAYYFSEEGLQSLFEEEGFKCKETKVYCRQLENRSRKIVMDRRWIQAVFYLPQQPMQLGEDKVNIEPLSRSPKESLQPVAQVLESTRSDTLVLGKKLASSATLETVVAHKNSSSTGDAELIVDLSEGGAAELFGGAPPIEPLEVACGSYKVYAKCLSKENQHTYASTGFMLWESAYAFAELLAANTDFLKEKSVLELGCGSVGLCSLMSSVEAKKVVATDSDVGALSLLQDNLHLNKENFSIGSIVCQKLEWGNKADIDAVRAANNGTGYDLIIGTDVTYVHEAVPLLFETARALLREPSEPTQEPLLILCHRIRRVAESDILSSAISHGFHVVGHWHSGVPSSSNIKEVESMKQSYVESLFKQGLQNVALNYRALQIICLAQLQYE